MTTGHSKRRDDILAEIETLNWMLNDLRSDLSRDNPGDVPQGSLQAMICRLEANRVAIPIAAIDEVVPMCSLAPAPGTPEWIPGLVNLRGKLIPVVDLAERLGSTLKALDPHDSIVILHVAEHSLGLVVQEVMTVEHIDLKHLTPARAELPLSSFVFGVVSTEGTPVFLLSLSSIVKSDECLQTR